MKSVTQQDLEEVMVEGGQLTDVAMVFSYSPTLGETDRMCWIAIGKEYSDVARVEGWLMGFECWFFLRATHPKSLEVHLGQIWRCTLTYAGNVWVSPEGQGFRVPHFWVDPIEALEVQLKYSSNL